MEDRYLRNFPALTEEQFLMLRGKKVCVVGCGGLGGHIIEFLARIGIGTIRCIDGDSFDATNLNRQLLSQEALLGSNKAETAARRINAINSSVSVEALPVYLTAENARDLIDGFDAVLDGLDSIAARKVLEQACAEARIPCIYGAISGWVAQAGISLPGDRLISKLYPKDAALTDRSVLSFTPALCASMQTALCVKLLTNRPVDTGVIYYFDLLNQEFETIPLV